MLVKSYNKILNLGKLVKNSEPKRSQLQAGTETLGLKLTSHEFLHILVKYQINADEGYDLFSQ